jgi:AcrR family transcriptional regulator
MRFWGFFLMSGALVGGEVGATDRRELIMNAATNLFCKNGYSGTRMSDIAEAINVTKPIVYRYYASKEELFSAWVDIVLVQKCVSIIEQIKNSPKNVEDTAKDILDRSLEGLNSSIILAPWRIALVESDNFPQITQLVCDKFKTPLFNAIIELFDKGIKSGEINNDDSKNLALLFCAPIAAAASLYATFGPDFVNNDNLGKVFAEHHKCFFAFYKK